MCGVRRIITGEEGNIGGFSGEAHRCCNNAAKKRFMSGIITQQGKTGYNMKYIEIKNGAKFGFLTVCAK